MRRPREEPQAEPSSKSTGERAHKEQCARTGSSKWNSGGRGDSWGKQWQGRVWGERREVDGERGNHDKKWQGGRATAWAGKWGSGWQGRQENTDHQNEDQTPREEAKPTPPPPPPIPPAGPAGEPKGADYLGYYKTLGLDYACTEEEAAAAFKKLALKCHPDKMECGLVESVKKSLTALFTEALAAKEVLADQNKRTDYDSDCCAGPERHSLPLRFPWFRGWSRTQKKLYYTNTSSHESTWVLPDCSHACCH